MLKEFKAFISRGNVIDLAVGVIIGGAFTAIVTSLTTNLINPFIGIFLGKIDLSNLALKKLFEISKSGVGKLRQTLKLPSLYWCAAVVHSFSRADDIFPTS